MSRHPSLDDRFDPAVRIVAYDPAWPALAAEEIRAIQAAMGDVAVGVEHVGSTAVHGLAAKPIIDLQLSVEAIEELDRYRGPLERLYGHDEELLERMIRRVVLHEIAHHFGISDERLVELDRY